MKIEIWSDYVCPFCYIGKRRLEEAMQETGLGRQAEVVFKSYQLDPHAPESADESVVAGLAQKYGISIQEAQQMLDNVAEQAKTVGLQFDTEAMKPANTFQAHRLAKLAEREGVAAEVVERLLKGHFILGEVLGQQDVLLSIAEEAGMDRARAEEMLASDEFSEEVRSDIEEAGQLGVRGVPFFVINRKYAISGAQPSQVFADALRKAAQEESSTGE
ncbi:DsbA family oxidoreductase [Sporosarcina sp. 179-K 3D1 HS]|uniref:DsbA family oxidoreductase n=1 Tax=Sporosarcina sp. 179-K 3D1 HS TaxID=3232169 RepID=UPI0039A0987D